MTNEDWDQLAHHLDAEQKDRLIGILCGPEEDWSEVDGEIVLRLYGIDPKPDPALAENIVANIVQEKRYQGEQIPEELLNLLEQLKRNASTASRQDK